MPVLKDMSESATDLFLGHEVGHALYTPAGGIESLKEKGNIFFGVVNIVEDARIEKMIQNKFPGLKKSFYDGYGDLIDKDFFSINGKDLTTYNLIDRLNVHFKAGVRAGVEFSAEEKVFVDRMENLRSWEESLKLAEDLFDHSAENFTPPDMSDLIGEPGDDGEPAESGDPSDSDDSDDSGEMKSDGLTVKDDDGEAGDEDGESSDGAGDDEKKDEKNDSPGNAEFDHDDSDDDDDSEEPEEKPGDGHEGGRDSSDINNPEDLESKTQKAFDKRV